MTTAALLDLKGRHALVAGVGGQLARPAAVALAEAGATVSLMTHADDRAQEVEAQSILNECWSLGRDGQVARLDSSDAATVATALDRLEAQHGRVSLLVTVPQPISRRPALQATSEDWQAALVSTSTTVVPALTAGRRMVEHAEGHIVVLVARLPFETEPDLALAAASQAAVLTFTDALAIEWAPLGVVVAPLIVEEVEGGAEIGPYAHAAFRAELRSLLTGVSNEEAVASAGGGE